MAAYSVIVPAYNEADYLPATLQRLKTAMASVEAPGEIIVVDNNSTDETASIARTEGARVVFDPVNQIARARNAGARAASAESEYLVFLDADTRLDPETLRLAIESLQSGTICGGGAIVVTDHRLPSPISGFLHAWNFVAPRFGWAAGCFIFCLRKGYDAAGGFDERFYAGEEVWFSNQLRKWGKKKGQRFKVLAEPPVVTSGRKANWFTPWQFFRQLGMLMIFPFAARSRRFCSMWYQRPATGE